MSTARRSASLSVFRSCRRGAAALALPAGLSVAALLWVAPVAIAQVSFSGPTSFPVGNQPRSVAIGDFDGDADFDLATANADSDDVSVLLGAGDGSFTAGPGAAAGDLPFSVAVGEFNDDGDPDLAVANRDSANVSVLLGATGSGFSAADPLLRRYARHLGGGRGVQR